MNDKLLEKACEIIGVEESDDGEAVFAKYLDKVLLMSIDNAKQIEELNNYLELIVYFKKSHESHFPRIFVKYDYEKEKFITSRIYDPHFEYYYWNPLLLDFARFERSFLLKREINKLDYKKMLKYFAPLRCLERLCYIKNNHLLVEKGIDLFLKYDVFNKDIGNISFVLDLERTSYFDRTININELEPETVLQWRIMVENNRYPYSVEVLTTDGKSLGEIPNEFSACLCHLLTNNYASMQVISDSIVKKSERGKYARCSLISVKLNINLKKNVPLEIYSSV